MYALILDNRRLTVVEVANQLQSSHGSAYEIFHDRLHSLP